MLSASGNEAGATSASTDPSRPAPISLTKLYADNPEAFKTPEQPLVIDAGIVFAGQPTYLCFPIEKFGINNADDIIDITTSCECVTVGKVRYEDSGGGIRDCLRISIFPEDQTLSTSLLVQIDLLNDHDLTNSALLRFAVTPPVPSM